MANRTIKDAQSIHGTNPQYLVEKIIRTRIYDSRYWKEECFALTAELLVDKAMELKYVGGVYGGNIKPTPFICLTLKMLQIQPEKDIIIEFIKQDEFKYVRALGAYYLRLVYTSLDCYKYLEPLLNDYRKLRAMDRNGNYHLLYMDEYIDHLLKEERYLDVIFPRVQKRWVHESVNELEGRVSLLDDDLEEFESESEDEDALAVNVNDRSKTDQNVHVSHNRDERHSRHSPAKEARHEKGRREKRRRSRERGGEHERKRRRSHSRERRHKSPNHREKRREHKRIREKEHHNRDRVKTKDHHHRERKQRHRAERRDARDDDAEIAIANSLRAKLGMPPLRM